MKATGSITYSSEKNLNTFDAPGAKRGDTKDNYAIYNNTMGILNLVETPVVEERIFNPGHAKGKKTIAIYQRLTTPIKYAVNPASGLRLKEIKAAFVYGKARSGDKPYAANLVKEGRGYRTNYLPLGCLQDQYFGVFFRKKLF